MSYYHLFIKFALSLIVAAVFISGYWLFYPYQPFEFKTPKNRILTPEVRAGEEVVWEVDIIHHTSGKKVEVGIQLVDGFITAYPTNSYITQAGPQKFTRAVTVPKYVPPGKYYISVFNSVRVNPLRTIEIIRESEEFTVVK